MKKQSLSKKKERERSGEERNSQAMTGEKWRSNLIATNLIFYEEKKWETRIWKELSKKWAWSNANEGDMIN